MKFTTPLVWVGFVVAGGLLLGGCVQQAPPVVPTAEPSVTPVFASDADALAAAKKAYSAYVSVSDAITKSGGRDPERVRAVVTEKWLPHELTGFARLSASHKRIVGTSTWTYFRLQRQSENAAGIADVHVYVCDDFSKSRVLDSAGNDVTPTTRRNFLPAVADFQSATALSANLLFAGSEPWTGENFCL